MKRTPINPVSKRRRQRDKGYNLARREVWARADGRCEVRTSPDCTYRCEQVHHRAGRTGPDPHRLDNLVGCCAPCHSLIHANPEWAYKWGWMVHRHAEAGELLADMLLATVIVAFAGWIALADVLIPSWWLSVAFLLMTVAGYGWGRAADRADEADRMAVEASGKARAWAEREVADAKAEVRRVRAACARHRRDREAEDARQFRRIERLERDLEVALGLPNRGAGAA